LSEKTKHKSDKKLKPFLAPVWSNSSIFKAQTAQADGNRFSAPTAQNGTGVAVLEPGNCHPSGIRQGAFEL
jgi:hypothetical protein